MPDLERSRPLDVHRWSAFPPVRAAVDQVFTELQQTEAARGAQGGKLKLHLTVVLLDLFIGHLLLQNGYTAYSRNGNSYKSHSRYNKLRIGFTPLIRVVDGLVQLGYVENHNGFHDRETGIGRQSRMRATARLIDLIGNRHAVRPEMIGRTEDEEVIHLKDSAGNRIEYTDTAGTRRMRAMVRRYNEALSQARITLSDEGVRLAEELGQPIDFSRTRVYRVFNRGSFKLGGRFYGPWWQNLPKELRCHILIDGQPTCECDYRAQHIYLLYSLKGVPYDSLYQDGDPYLLEGHGPEDRAFLKKVQLIALNAANQREALQAIQSKINKGLGEGRYTQADASRMIDEFALKHATIAEYIFSDIGLHLQFLDSRISERIIEKHMDRNAVCLDIHDSFIVMRALSDQLTEIMPQTFVDLKLPSIPPIIHNE